MMMVELQELKTNIKHLTWMVSVNLVLTIAVLVLVWK